MASLPEQGGRVLQTRSTAPLEQLEIFMGAEPGKKHLLATYPVAEPRSVNDEAEIHLLLSKLGEEWKNLLSQTLDGYQIADLVEIYIQQGKRPVANMEKVHGPEKGTKFTVFLTETELCQQHHVDDFLRFFDWEARLRETHSKRTGIPGTLHRISMITKGTDRNMRPIGVIARVGRNIRGIISNMCPWLDARHNLTLQPLPKPCMKNKKPAPAKKAKIPKSPYVDLTRKSILLIGRPGVGKTTVLREIAHCLSAVQQSEGSAPPTMSSIFGTKLDTPNAKKAKKEWAPTVVVVDKTNEIAGDADEPHSCIGDARWMPCGNPDLQPQIMREAVENGSPDVVIVDEISNEHEVTSARTVAERGVGLIASVHGKTIADILKCKVRHMLVGGLTSVTLSSQQAQQREDGRKTIQERIRSPVFDIAIELHDRDKWILHYDVAHSVDAYLNGEPFDCIELSPGTATAICGVPTPDGLVYCRNCYLGECTIHTPDSDTESEEEIHVTPGYAKSNPPPPRDSNDNSNKATFASLGNYNSNNGAKAKFRPRVQRSGNCYKCGKKGHFARECWYR